MLSTFFSISPLTKHTHNVFFEELNTQPQAPNPNRTCDAWKTARGDGRRWRAELSRALPAGLFIGR
jgi:hypothetical protein